MTRRPSRDGRSPGGGRARRNGPDRVRSFYRALLRMYPKDFQARYRADLLQAFDDRRDEARFRGTLGGIRLVLFLLRDFVTSMPLAHRRKHQGKFVGARLVFQKDLAVGYGFAVLGF